MHSLANTAQLVADGVITPEQERVIKARARDIMVALAVNTVLCGGIVAATFGTIFWLADAALVAVFGTLLLAGGLALLAKGAATYRMFGNAAALIGAGMLIGGAGLELVDKYPDVAGWIMLAGGAVVVVIAGRALMWGGLTARFVAGSILLMGLALHIGGLGFLLDEAGVTGAVMPVFYLYVTLALLGAGWLTDVRFVTALAIAPFAQMLDTGTAYFHAAYVFYSPEPTLSIVQMALLIGLTLWLAPRVQERTARHLRTLTIFGFIVANLCALVGSLFGDLVGRTLWGADYPQWTDTMTAEQYEALRAAHEAQAFAISANVYSVVWAIVLAGMVFWSAHRGNRALFNASVTFAGIHAYTQIFESFYDEPLAYVIGGFAAIPLAWGMWRLNQWLGARAVGQ